jgi:mono/diheme cytochrome c family protein
MRKTQVGPLRFTQYAFKNYIEENEKIMWKKLSLLPVILLLLVACGGTAEPAAQAPGSDTEAAAVSVGDPAAGERLYMQSCSACHGPDAQGIPGLGRSMVGTEFFASHDDQEILEFVKQGRPATHPDNEAGVDMPPKGGNPALTDAQILDIIAYLRSLD